MAWTGGHGLGRIGLGFLHMVLFWAMVILLFAGLVKWLTGKSPAEARRGHPELTFPGGAGAVALVVAVMRALMLLSAHHGWGPPHEAQGEPVQMHVDAPKPAASDE